MSKPLNTRQKKFVDNYVLKGLSIAESVRRAGYSIKSGKVEDASSYGCKLLRQDRVKTYLQKLKDKQFKDTALSLEEKRAFLASVVRSSPSQINADSPLCQEYAEEVDQQGNVKRKVKLVSKIEAIRTDNNMSGDNFADRQDQSQVNPFLFLVNFFTPSPGTLTSTPAMPAPPPVLEAEIVPPVTP
jgi:Terminase small subunit